jgi:gliding motility-associated-like protein
MKYGFTIFIVVICCLFLSAQDFTIDFEQIPNEIARENMRINTQYQELYGVRFVLEDGRDPVLAEVGFPAVAFGGSFGDDTPAPGQNIGSFFLTDDGILGGLNAPPLIIHSDNPLKKITAEILDIDFDERFLIQALDINGLVVKSIRIADGDPNTGDGLATKWIIEADECSDFYSVRIEGSRNQTGSFGLGLDNLLFELTEEVDFSQVSVDVLSIDCNQPEGAILINNAGAQNFTYSIDGTNFQGENIFNGLSPGNYVLTILSSAGCVDTRPFQIEAENPIIIMVIPEASSCEQRDGSIEVIASGGLGALEFRLNNGSFQPSGTFNNLASGFYSVEVRDEAGCLANGQTNIESSSAIGTLGVFVEPPDCGRANGTIEIQVIGASDQITVTLNQSLIPPNFIQEGVSAGVYELEVRDEYGCQEDTTFFVSQGICSFYIPNAFSPNNDGVNDRFMIYPHPQFAGTFNTFQIFDRWGDLVFEARLFNPLDIGWDGMIKNKPAAVGAYVFTLEVQHADGDVEFIKGDVSLVK